ncbi:MAG: hypothetical protein ABI333_16865 [bacterium]
MKRKLGILIALWGAVSLLMAGCGDDGGGSGDCGNDLVEAGEDCDGDNLDGRTCESLGLGSGVLLCTASCEYNLSACGNGTCGNGTIDSGEDCDGNELAGQDCTDHGFVGGTLDCDTGCAFDLSGCNAGADCGNGQLDAGEQCDGNALGSASCQSLGHDGGVLACLTNCAYDTSGCTDGLCGNGNLDSGEQCDLTNLNNQDCTDLGFVGGTLGCDTDCTYDVTLCEAGADCGNGNIDGTEECDGQNLNNQDCTDQGYVGGTLLCLSNCAYNTSLCVYEICGNGQIEATEDCDGVNLGSASCTTEGHDGGTLSCAADCQSFVTTACCDDACSSAGDTTCNGNVLRTCASQSSGCLGYNDFDCSTGGQICVASGGSAQCEGTCTSNCTTLGATQCVGAVLQTCTQNGTCTNWVDSNCFPGSCTGSPAACQSSGSGAGCGDVYSLDGRTLPHQIFDNFDSGAVTDGGSCQAGTGYNPLYLSYTVTGPVDQLTITASSGGTVWPQISAWTTTSTTGFCDTGARTELGCNYAQTSTGELVLSNPSVSVGDVIYFIVTGDFSAGQLINPVIDLEVIDCSSTTTTASMTLPAQLSNVVVDSNVTVEFLGELPATNTGTIVISEDSVPVVTYDLSTTPGEVVFFGNQMTINPAGDFSTDTDVTVQLNLESAVCSHAINDSFTFHTEAGPPPNGEDCANAIPINDIGTTSGLAGNHQANSNDVMPTLMNCYASYNGVVDSVFTFNMVAPFTEVTITMPKWNSYRYAAVLNDSCPGSAPPLGCTVSDEDETMILIASGLSAGPHYLVVGNAWSDPFPDNTFDSITIDQYRSQSPTTPAAGVGTIDAGGGPVPLTAGMYPINVIYSQYEDLTLGDMGTRVITAPSAQGFLIEGTFNITYSWHYLRAKSPAGVFYLNKIGISSGSYSVYVPGASVTIGMDTTGSSTVGSGYTINAVYYH